MHSSSSPLLHAAVQAVAKACDVTRRLQQRGLIATTKADRSPVTVADFAAQAIITRSLQADLGTLKLIGEEDSGMLRESGSAALCEAIAAALRPSWPEVTLADVITAVDAGQHEISIEGFWTLDPIDGTKGYLRGGQYAISLAYIDAGKVRLGVLGCPNLSADQARPFDTPDPHGLLFYATRDDGTWCVPADRPAETPARVLLSPHEGPIRFCESIESAHSRQDRTKTLVNSLGATVPLRLDSQAKYAVVARGQADAYLRIPTDATRAENIWDHAAGMIVAAEAGAVVTDMQGRALDFSAGKQLFNNYGVVCAAPAWHARLLDQIAKLNLV